MSHGKNKVPDSNKTSFFGNYMDCSVLLDFGHVRGIYMQGFKRKRYSTIEFGGPIRSFVRVGKFWRQKNGHKYEL